MIEPDIIDQNIKHQEGELANIMAFFRSSAPSLYTKKSTPKPKPRRRNKHGNILKGQGSKKGSKGK